MISGLTEGGTVQAEKWGFPEGQLEEMRGLLRSYAKVLHSVNECDRMQSTCTW